MKQLQVDRLTPAEIRTLDAAQQIGILDELFGEVKHLADLRCEAIDLHASARIVALNEQRKPAACPKVVSAKAMLDKAATMISARKQQCSILQTLLRTAGALVNV